MLRPVHLALLFLLIAVVACLEEPSEAARAEIEPPLNNADLDADASSYGYGRPWRYGWGGSRGGWGGSRGGWGGWGGRGWGGRGGWW